MALSLRDFLSALGDDLIRVDDEVYPITQAGALCSAAPRPIVLNRLKGFPGWKLCDILVKNRRSQARALGVEPAQDLKTLAYRLRQGALGAANTMPLLLDAVRAHATIGEMCNVLRDAWGEYEEAPII